MLRLSRSLFLRPGWVATWMLFSGIFFVGFSQGQESTGSTAVAPSEDAGDLPLELDDTSVQEPVDEDPLGLSPDFIAAYNSLDESLQYDPEKTRRIRKRIVVAGLLGGTLLGLLVVIFGFLKLNHLTRGFYSGRLQTLSIASVVLILALCYFLWTQVLFK